MSESYLQGKILKYLLGKGAYAKNIHGNEFQSSIPDVLVCYKGLFIAFELKSADGTLTGGQRKNLRHIQKAGGIGEDVRSLQRAKTIIETIDKGEVWVNGSY